MIVEDDLRVVWGVDFPSGHVLVQFDVGVHVNHLPVAFVSEQQTGFAAARVHLEVGTVVGCADSSLPVVVAQISGFGHESHLPLENRSKILSFESMGVVDIT